jgi:hypothetical protein
MIIIVCCLSRLLLGVYFDRLGDYKFQRAVQPADGSTCYISQHRTKRGGQGEGLRSDYFSDSTYLPWSVPVQRKRNRTHPAPDNGANDRIKQCPFQRGNTSVFSLESET